MIDTPTEPAVRDAPLTRRLRELPARGAIFCIELYRTYVSPLRMPTCRFTPTCSEYAVESLRTHGLWKGSALAAVRLAKCGPWHSGGWDPVPERRRTSSRRTASRHTPSGRRPAHVNDHSPLNLDEQRST
ncbi:membrane protein insertion efficiency factor YidD [Rhodococcus triatomae]|uniref:membrane protein insertion efficiency factor YidD n=1 Tax=Rhodococcus triatomae TaxID=300028 RepID=UPI000932FB64|nr:membrane protein insertion efficiency factor YidD [Rhodococcus triatomae]QNG20745.1 membrane protein insertion efficiency factor YidD [Rhodococcus triatomae]QNG23338.1 membrane protein insertion efficiency factor YidD [Rhodococcus triatomae]